MRRPIPAGVENSMRTFLLSLLLVNLTCLSHGQDTSEKKSKKNAPKKTISVEELAEKAKPSIVVILHTGRQGKQAGLGTGFVVDADGLIATNYHVIGEARPITVLMPDGAKHDVISVHASDRH